MNKQELNKCAQKLHEAYISTGDYSLFDTPEYSLSWNIIFSTYAARNYGSPKYEDIVSEVLLTTIKHYNIEIGDFENFFNYCLNQKKKDKLEKERKRSEKETSLDSANENDDGSETPLIRLLRTIVTRIISIKSTKAIQPYRIFTSWRRSLR